MASLLALTSNNVLLSFESERPTEAKSITITGVDGTLLGVDTRPANGLVYGITDTDNIYTIDPNSGSATFVSTLDIPFNATTISGFDFNPVADRLRLVGDNDQDFRINVETGEVTVDGDLAFAGDDVNAGDDPSITAAAYTNSFAGTTSTMLYDIDEAQDILVLQDPPNDGVLKTIGELGIDFDETGGFEISSAAASNNTAFAVSDETLYSIDLGSGAATALGSLDSDNSPFRGLTTRPDLPVDAIAQDAQFLALTNDDNLVSFDPNRPDRTTKIAVSGIDAPLLGIDTRPSNGLIYGITTANTIYTINPNTGAATKVSTLDTSFEGTTVSGFDFNPVADRLRLVGDNDQDFRINVETGAVTVDGTLAFADGDVNAGANPRVTAAAYTNAIANPTTTQLYDIDADLNTLVLQNPPNDGTLMTIGELGIEIDDLAGFDIVSSGEGNNAAFAVTDSTLYSIDLLTGAATRVGAIDTGEADGIKGLATVKANNVAPGGEVDPIANNSRFLALSDDNKIASFKPGNPRAVRSIDITGLRDQETLLGFDTRPSNGLIYGITDADNIYTIDPNSGSATFVSTLDIPFNATTISGFDFNPVADRLRLVGDNDQDFRINVETGAVTVDGNLAYAAGDANAGQNPTITAAAYTNAIAAPTATQLYDIDTDLDTLVLQNPPNDGTLMTVGALGVDFDTLGGFDIVSSDQGSNAAFAVSNGTLYSIDLLTGAASSLGAVGDHDSTYLGLATVSNDVIDPTTISVRADANGLASAVVYDTTGANQASADLGNNPADASDAAFDNFVGFYEVTGLSGGIDTDDDGSVDLNPGDDGYAAAAIGQRLDNFAIRTGGRANDNTSDDSFNPVLLAGGTFYAPFIIANLGDTTPEDFLTNNPNNSAAVRSSDQVAYFSFIEANPDGVSHLKSLGSGTFGFEDLPGNLGGSDNDFNDAVFQVDITAV